MSRIIEFKVLDSTTGKKVDSLENGDKIIFDVFENNFKILSTEGKLYDIDEKYNFCQYIGQKDINDEKIYDEDNIKLEDDLEGKVRFVPELASYQVFYKSEYGELESYYDILDIDDYKELIKENKN